MKYLPRKMITQLDVGYYLRFIPKHRKIIIFEMWEEPRSSWRDDGRMVRLSYQCGSERVYGFEEEWGSQNDIPLHHFTGCRDSHIYELTNDEFLLFMIGEI